MKSLIVDHVRSIATPDIVEKCVDIVEGKSRWFSQSGQDWYMYHNFFSHSMDTIKHGFYLDVGSNHPLEISNSFFFDRCLGWKGICVEPNPQYHAFYKDRSCKLVKTCLDSSESNVGFESNGVAGHIDMSGTPMKCTTLHALLRDVPKVDFASIDIEGNEESVFRCLNMTNLDIQVWAVETNKVDAATFDVPFFRNGYYKATQILAFSPVTKDSFGDLLDTIYVKRHRPEILPQSAGPCSPEDLKENPWCGTIIPVYEHSEKKKCFPSMG